MSSIGSCSAFSNAAVRESRASLILLMAVALCMPGGKPAAEPVTLEGTYWRLRELNGSPVTLAEGAAAPHIALHRDTMRLAGFGGCNRFFGRYSSTGDRITIEPLGGGRASCAQTNELERSLITALAAVGSYRLDAGRLHLLSGDRTTLVFESVAGR